MESWQIRFNELWFGDSKKNKIGLLTTILTAEGDAGASKLISDFISKELQNETLSAQLEQEINDKIIVLHGNKEQVMLPLYLWNEVVRKIYK